MIIIAKIQGPLFRCVCYMMLMMTNYYIDYYYYLILLLLYVCPAEWLDKKKSVWVKEG